MTGGSFISTGIMEHDMVNQRRFITGFLDQIVCFKTMKTKRRWVVYQGDTKTGIFQLKSFKKMDEKILKSAYTINKDTFMGIERGMMQRPAGRRGKAPIEYWAIMLAADTILFQESKSPSRDLFVKKMASADLASWYSLVKSQFVCESWTVFPLKGVVAPEFKTCLHATSHVISLATLSPPKCFQCWDLKRITEVSARDDTVRFHVDGTGSDAGYRELKTESKQAAREIYRTITSLSRPDPSRPDHKALPPPRLFTRPDLPKPKNVERYSASPSRVRAPYLHIPTPDTR